MFCSKCSKEIPNESEFCPYCGKSLREGQKSWNMPSLILGILAIIVPIILLNLDFTLLVGIFSGLILAIIAVILNIKAKKNK